MWLRFWLDICTSPELLIFVFFMMSDPKSAPRNPGARLAYGAATALVAAVLVAAQPTEFGVKVAILASLVVVCSLVPLFDGAPREIGQRAFAMLAQPGAAVVLLIAIAAPILTVRLAADQGLLDLERSGSIPGAAARQ